jgi:hypothetical protein
MQISNALLVGLSVSASEKIKEDKGEGKIWYGGPRGWPGHRYPYYIPYHRPYHHPYYRRHRTW